MANYNEHKCFACGQVFEYCRRCVITPVVYKAEGFCSEQCAHIFNTLSKHSCELITADEALADISAYNLDDITLTEDILEHIEELKSEVGVKVVEEPVEVEDTISIEETATKNNKNNKKKW